jgi:hypothetical protein
VEVYLAPAKNFAGVAGAMRQDGTRTNRNMETEILHPATDGVPLAGWGSGVGLRVDFAREVVWSRVDFTELRARAVLEAVTAVRGGRPITRGGRRATRGLVEAVLGLVAVVRGSVEAVWSGWDGTFSMTGKTPGAVDKTLPLTAKTPGGTDKVLPARDQALAVPAKTFSAADQTQAAAHTTFSSRPKTLSGENMAFSKRDKTQSAPDKVMSDGQKATGRSEMAGFHTEKPGFDGKRAVRTCLGEKTPAWRGETRHLQRSNHPPRCRRKSSPGMAKTPKAIRCAGISGG